MGGGGEAIMSRARSWSAPSIAIGRRRRIVQARRARRGAARACAIGGVSVVAKMHPAKNCPQVAL